jgi:hypothetical protein
MDNTCAAFHVRQFIRSAGVRTGKTLPVVIAKRIVAHLLVHRKKVHRAAAGGVKFAVAAHEIEAPLENRHQGVRHHCASARISGGDHKGLSRVLPRQLRAGIARRALLRAHRAVAY